MIFFSLLPVIILRLFMSAARESERAAAFKPIRQARDQPLSSIAGA